jgi:hypothetical protein
MTHQTSVPAHQHLPCRPDQHTTTNKPAAAYHPLAVLLLHSMPPPPSLSFRVDPYPFFMHPSCPHGIP